MHDLCLAAMLISTGDLSHTHPPDQLALETIAVAWGLKEADSGYPSTLPDLQDAYRRSSNLPPLYLRELLPDKETCSAMLRANTLEQARAQEEWELTNNQQLLEWIKVLKIRHRVWDKAEDVRSVWPSPVAKRELLRDLQLLVGDELQLPAAVPYKGER